MTKSQIVATLSELPVEILNDIRINANISFNANPNAPKLGQRSVDLIVMCNEALEAKQLNHFSLYEDVTDEPIGI